MGDIFRNTEFVDWLGEQRPFYGNFVGVESPPYRVRFNISQSNSFATVYKWFDTYPKIKLTNQFTNTIREVQPFLTTLGTGYYCSNNYVGVEGEPQIFGYFTGDTGQKIIAEIDLTSLAASNYNFYIAPDNPRAVYKIEYSNFRAGFNANTHRCTATDYYTDSTTNVRQASIFLANPQLTPVFAYLSSTTLNEFATGELNFTGTTSGNTCSSVSSVNYYRKYGNPIELPWYVTNGTNIISSTLCVETPFPSPFYIRGSGLLQPIGLVSGNTVSFVGNCVAPASPTPTATQTKTPTPTPSVTPNFVCPEKVEISNHSFFPELDGFYERVYSYPGGSYNYGYIDLVGSDYVFSAGPYLGDSYPVFVNNNTISPYSAATLVFNAYENAWDILDMSIVTGGFISNTIAFSSTTQSIGGGLYPTAGDKDELLSPGQFLLRLTYPVVCPTPTPSSS